MAEITSAGIVEDEADRATVHANGIVISTRLARKVVLQS